MSLLDRFKPGLSVVFVRYDREKYAGAWESLCRHLESVGGGLMNAVVVDNASEGAEERRLNDRTVEIGGDNRAWEFSAFDLGVEWLKSKGQLHDLTLLVTDAFRAYGDDYLALVDRPLLQFCRRHSAAAGWLDSFMEPCRLLDVDYEAWFRTSCLVLPSNALNALQPFAWPLPEERIFGPNSNQPWHRDAPLSANLRKRIEEWLLAPSDASLPRDATREVWHSQFTLDDDTSGLFRHKVKAILREHHLTHRVREAGLVAYDLRVLGDIIVRGREPASDGSECFFAGLRAWLARDQADEAGSLPTLSQTDPRLIFGGDLSDATQLATVRGFSARVMPLILQRFPRATFEVPAEEPPGAIAGIVGVNGSLVGAPEWVMEAGGAGVAAVVTVDRAAPAAAWREVERIHIDGPSVSHSAAAVAGRCCEALARAEERLVLEGERRAESSAPLAGVGTGPARLSTLPLRWRADYQAWRTEHADELGAREDYERALASDTRSFSLKALCRSCKRETAMHVDFEYGGDPDQRRPNWRERLVCQECGLNSKMRGVLHVLMEVVVPGPKPRVFVWELGDEMTVAAREHFGDATGNQVGGELPVAGDDGLFDCLTVLDMFERTPDLDDAIARSLELLKPGGGLAFSASFRSDRERIRDRSEVEAGDSGRVFGWAMLDRFRDGGFEDVVAHFFWSPAFGYLGTEQVVFVARKGDAVG